MCVIVCVCDVGGWRAGLPKPHLDEHTHRHTQAHTSKLTPNPRTTRRATSVHIQNHSHTHPCIQATQTRPTHTHTHSHTVHHGWPRGLTDGDGLPVMLELGRAPEPVRVLDLVACTVHWCACRYECQCVYVRGRGAPVADGPGECTTKGSNLVHTGAERHHECSLCGARTKIHYVGFTAR